jgi:hypothetical protein
VSRLDADQPHHIWSQHVATKWPPTASPNAGDGFVPMMSIELKQDALASLHSGTITPSIDIPKRPQCRVWITSVNMVEIWFS